MWDSTHWSAGYAARRLPHLVRFERWAWNELEAARKAHLPAATIRERVARVEFASQLIAGVQEQHPNVYGVLLGQPAASNGPSNTFSGRKVSSWERRAVIPRKHPGLMRIDARGKYIRGVVYGSVIRPTA